MIIRRLVLGTLNTTITLCVLILGIMGVLFGIGVGSTFFDPYSGPILGGILGGIGALIMGGVLLAPILILVDIREGQSDIIRRASEAPRVTEAGLAQPGI